MFTGLIEEVGKIESITPMGGGKRIRVKAKKIMDDLKIDDSVAINGVCQTVVSFSDSTFDVDAVEETIRKSTFALMRTGDEVNLERAAKLGDRLGGHIVQGHVDTPGRVISVGATATDRLVWISFPSQFEKYVVNSGSVTINGVSLTTARVDGPKFMVTIIPHTWDVTILRKLKAGDEVNLEFDIIGKYIEKLTLPHIAGGKKSDGGLDKYITQPEW